jgi:hypothetical protein
MDRNVKAKDSQGTHSQLLTPPDGTQKLGKIAHYHLRPLSLPRTSGWKNRLTRDGETSQRQRGQEIAAD